MLTIQSRNVNDAYHEALWKIAVHGIRETTRNGTVLVNPGPVMTSYVRPWERMLFDPKRDANPYFHVMEAMWMLAGERATKPLEFFNKTFNQFNDDGVTMNGAYGHRWRYYFDIDQIKWVIGHLRDDPNSRRAVLGMWDPASDPFSIDSGTKDVPCNTHIYFRRNGGKLDMTVCCRSNDIVWGCYGANAVHMSYLQEFIAEALGWYIGTYYQMSNNWHLYEPHFDLQRPSFKFTENNAVFAEHEPLLGGTSYLTLLDALPYVLKEVWDGTFTPFGVPYIDNVLVPMIYSWRFHKVKDQQQALAYAYKIKDGAISLACLEWLGRRYDGSRLAGQ